MMRFVIPNTNRRTLLLDVEENKAVSSQGNLLLVPASKQSRHPCPANHHNGGPVSVFDDSTLSEVSEDEARYICSMAFFSYDLDFPACSLCTQTLYTSKNLSVLDATNMCGTV